MNSDSRKLIELLKASRRILVFTGAGISTGSGIPDFRGPNGVWKRRKPVFYQDFMTSETARIEHWDYKFESWEATSTAKPNTVHFAIAKLEKEGKVEMVVTQNIDGLHALAGTSSDNLIELHGTNSLVECQSCRWRSNPKPFMEQFQRDRRCPRCECGGFLKAATISFGQNLDSALLVRARDAALNSDLVIALGSTLSVQPACSFPLMAAQNGAPYIIINRGETEHDHKTCVSLRLDGDVADIFPIAVDVALSLGVEMKKYVKH